MTNLFRICRVLPGKVCDQHPHGQAANMVGFQVVQCAGALINPEADHSSCLQTGHI